MVWEYLRLLAFMLLTIGWLLLAATVPGRSFWRLLLGVTAVSTAIRFVLELFATFGKPLLSSEIENQLLTPALFLVVFVQFVVMYRKDGVRR